MCVYKLTYVLSEVRWWMTCVVPSKRCLQPPVGRDCSDLMPDVALARKQCLFQANSHKLLDHMFLEPLLSYFKCHDVSHCSCK